MNGGRRYVRSCHAGGKWTHVYARDHEIVLHGKHNAIARNPRSLTVWEREWTTREERPKCLCGTVIFRPRWMRRPIGEMCPRCEELAGDAA